MPGYNTEADYENAIIELFRNDLGYEYVYGPDVERDFNSPLYDAVLEESLYRLNKGLPADAINDALLSKTLSAFQTRVSRASKFLPDTISILR